MRRFELIDGTSRKFWQVRSHGPEITVTFGRIGTEGQSKTKSLASMDAAEAEVARLIREKTAKGYVEVGLQAVIPAPAIETQAPQPQPQCVDTSTPGTRRGTVGSGAAAVPESTAHPGLGRSAGAAMEPARLSDAGRSSELRDASASTSAWTPSDGLVWPSAGFLWTEQRLAELPPMRGLLSPSSLDPADTGNADPDPAALKAWPFDVDPRQCTDLELWSQACSQTDLLGRVHRRLVQTAAALHGLPFALELALTCAQHWLASNPSLYTYAGDRPAHSLRKRLAVCSESVHAACVEVAARFRGAALEIDAMICFMLPEQAAWANESAQHPDLGEEVEASWLDDTALSPANALRVLRGRYGSAFGWQLYFDTPKPAQTALLQLRLHGVGALPLFDAAISEYARYPRMQPALERLLGMLECVEAPETFTVLFRHVEQEAVRHSLQRLATRWPVALFKSALLTPRRSEALEDWAVGLAANMPDIVDVALEASTPAERARMDTVVRARLRPIEAPLDALPAALREAMNKPAAGKGKIAPLPPFFDARTLIRPQLRSGGALSEAAMVQLGRLLAASTLQAAHPALEAVRAACTPESLSECAWSLFRAWQRVGSPSKQVWAFAALGLLGNDAVAHRLAPLIREWPGQSAHARATLGLDILAALGSDAALMQLNGIAEKVKHAGLQARARERIEHIAAARGLTPIELADRLVPDLGLDAQGVVSLDFGTRQFQVTLDDAMKPRLRDATGRLLKDLPKPGRGDDPELAEAAVLQFKALKKDAKAVAALHVPRLERAMCEGRRWRPAVFERLFVAHPWTGLLARRLLWGVYREGVLIDAVRIAEDHSLADSEDGTCRLAEDVEVGIVHPLELPAELAAAFGSRFSDYEIVQPFRQLGRETHTVDPAERQAGELLRFKDRKTSAGALMSLAARGWESDTSSYAIRRFTRQLPGGREVSVELEPGIQLGDIQSEPEQWLLKVDLPAADADPIQVSELIRDLELAAPL